MRRDEGLKELKNFKNLLSLDLYGTQVPNVGLTVPKEIKSLRALFVIDTKVTECGDEGTQGRRA